MGFTSLRNDVNSNAECGMRNAECGMRNYSGILFVIPKELKLFLL